MSLVVTTKLSKKADLSLLIVAYGLGLLLLNGCKDHLDLVKQELAEANQQSLIVDSNPDLSAKAVTTTVVSSSIVIADTPETDSDSSNLTDPIHQAPIYQGPIYQASKLPSPFRLPNFIDPSTQSTAIEKQSIDYSNLPDSKTDQPLSQFQYRGRMAGADEVTYGLIQRPDGVIMRVKVGQSVGQKPIRVIEITPTQINLIEQGGNSETGVTVKRLTLIAPVAP